MCKIDASHCGWPSLLLISFKLDCFHPHQYIYTHSWHLRLINSKQTYLDIHIQQ